MTNIKLDTWELVWIGINLFGALTIIIATLINKKIGNFVYCYGYCFNWSTFMLFIGIAWPSCDLQFQWVRYSSKFLGVRTNHLEGGRELYKGPRRTLFFANHTTVADLFLIELITEA
jgi:hypothetical protein